MDYSVISKEIMDHLYSGYASLKNSPLSQKLRVLLELRVSEINGCIYCCGIHQKEALNLGVDQEKLNDLEHFADSDAFSVEEKEALEWAESLTELVGHPKVENTRLHLYFTEREIVDITITISLMNMMNRLAISMLP